MKLISYTSIWHVIKSIFSAILGVQSREKANKDFQPANTRTFIIVAIIMFMMLIGGLVWIVNIVLS